MQIYRFNNKKKGFTRGHSAGVQMGKAIIEMINLMYQNRTAARFLLALRKTIQKEILRRALKGNNK